MNRNNNLIKTEKLCKYYPVKKQKIFEKQRQLKAVCNLDLEIPEGSTFGLVGESGCGKSTTGQVLSGILPITSGKLYYRGKDITHVKGEDAKQLRRKIQMIFQDPYASLNPKKKIGWILEEPLKSVLNMEKKERKQKVKDILQRVGLDETYMDKYPSELSGGQRQRVSIAAALSLNPEFIVCDEAVSALDVSVQAQILNLLKELQEENNLTYLFISHDLNVIEYMSDYIGVMYLGHLVEYGTADEVCNHPVHPYTKALLSAVPDIKGRKEKRIVLEGEVPGPVDTPSGCPFHTRCMSATERCREIMPGSEFVAENHVAACHLAEGEKNENRNNF